MTAPPAPGGRPAGASFVALLRGINVGGKNLIGMADLAACFRDAGEPWLRGAAQ